MIPLRDHQSTTRRDILDNSLKPIELMYIAVHTGNFYSNVSTLKHFHNEYKRLYPKINKVFENFPDTLFFYYNNKFILSSGGD